MKKREIIKMLVALGIGIVITIGGILGFKAFTKEEKQIPTQTIELNEKSSVSVYESIVEGINELNRLEVLQIQSSKIAKLSNNAKLSWFKNEMNIKYNCTSQVFVDFSKITKDNVVVGEDTITVYITKPQIESKINHNLTTCETDRGWLTMNDLELEPIQYENIEQKVIEEVTKEVEEKEMSEIETRIEDALEIVLSKLGLNKNIKIIMIG
jgi:hypothetical protein